MSFRTFSKTLPNGIRLSFDYYQQKGTFLNSEQCFLHCCHSLLSVKNDSRGRIKLWLIAFCVCSIGARRILVWGMQWGSWWNLVWGKSVCWVGEFWSRSWASFMFSSWHFRKCNQGLKWFRSESRGCETWLKTEYRLRECSYTKV